MQCSTQLQALETYCKKAQIHAWIVSFSQYNHAAHLPAAAGYDVRTCHNMPQHDKITDPEGAETRGPCTCLHATGILLLGKGFASLD